MAYFHESQCDSLSESCSTCKSSSSSIDSEASDWERAVDKKGNLFYLESYPRDSYQNNYSLDTLSKHPSAGFKGKLSKLIPKRHKKKSKNGDETYDGEQKPTAPQYSKEKCHEYQVQVRVCKNDVDGSSGAVSLSESVLGIVPARCNDLVVVQAVLPNCYLARHQFIRIGDALLKIEGTEVNVNNFSDILLQSLNCTKVEILFRRTIIEPGGLLNEAQNEYRSPLIDFQSGKEEQVKEEGPSASCVLFITLDDEDVMYKLGDESLCQLRGVFITLANEVQEISTSQPLNTTLHVGDVTLYISYAKENKDAFVVIAPSYRLSREDLEVLTAQIADLLKWEFGSLRRCFSDDGNKVYLDNFFHSVLDCSSDLSPAPSPLPLPPHIQIKVDMLLDEYESCYAENFMDQDYLKYQRPFTVVGSCLFHKGSLITWHLSADVLRLVYLYLNHHQLLKPVSQLVVWRSVTPLDPQLQDRRWFLMIVGQDYEVVAVILESGGCAVRWEGAVPPDPVYINRAQSLLLLLEDEGLVEVLTRWLEGGSNPPLANPSALIRGKDSTNYPTIAAAEESAVQGNQSGSTRTLSDSGERTTSSLRNAGGSCTSSSPSEDSQYQVIGRRAEREANRLSINLNGSKHTLGTSQLSTEKGLQSSTTSPLFQLTVGAYNTLFHMMNYLKNEGVIIRPYNAPDKNPVWEVIVKTFLQAYRRLEEQLIAKEESFMEQGMMFNYTCPEMNNRTLNYWVTGRRFTQPYSKMVCVCYQDSTPQNIVEIGFKLGLGVSI